MIEEQAKVIKSENGIAWVETTRQSACGKCSANKGCGVAALSSVLGQKRNRIKVIDPVGTQPGEWVILGLEETAMLQGSAMLYLTPLVALFAGGAVVAAFKPSAEWPVILGALAGLALGFVGLRRFLARVEKNPRFQPVILKRIVTVCPESNSVFPA